MTRSFACWVLAGWCAVMGPRAEALGASTCTGRFANPITDICWSCVLPITIGGAGVANWGNQEDIDNPSDVLCECVGDPRLGLAIGFWEPARQVEVVRSPFCLVSLGGVDLDPGIPAPEHGRNQALTMEADKSFYQAHFYFNDVLFWLDVIADFRCLERRALDIAYLTEVDPLWNDDELALILNPDAVLFANPVAIAACAADCVAASLGFGIRELFWCAGCQGSIYPMDGHAAVHDGGVRTAALLAQRLTAKMHRELVTWAWYGKDAFCGPYFQPVMDKRAYKTQLTYPIPSTGEIDGKCCQPFGRTTILWGAGKEFPVEGEDFSFMLFRKRNCCLRY